MKPLPSSLIEVLDFWSITLPDKVAYIFLADGESKEESITYFELRRRATIFAANLQNSAKPYSRVLLLNPPGIDFIISFLGCLYAGHIPVPLYPPDKHSLSRMISVSLDCDSTIALTNSDSISKFESYKQLYSDTLQRKSKDYADFLNVVNRLHLIDTDILQQDLYFAYNGVMPASDQTAFLQYTSGSTNHPKGVMVSHGNLVHNSMLIHKLVEHDPNHCKVSWLPPFHDMGLIGEILQSLYSGMTCVFMSPNSFLKKPVRWLKAITKYSHLGPISCGSPNFGYEFCIETTTDEQLEQLDLSAWKLAYNGAEPVRIATVERFIKKFSPCGFKSSAFHPVYGLAENTLLVSVSRISEEPVITKLDAGKLKNNIAVECNDPDVPTILLPACGDIIAEQKVIFVDPETLIECPEGHIGEIWIKGGSVAKGYWKNDEETARTFQAHLSNTNEGPFMRTGDLGFMLNKRLYITGRLKDMVIICGQNHYPQDIELTVEETHEAIRVAGGAAFSIEKDENEVLVVVYELKRKLSKNLNLDELKSLIRDTVFKKHGLIIFDIVFIEQSTFPKTSSGKLQRRLCKKMYLENTLEVVNNETNVLN
jgi:acyl-CoA synthetase (AMP-forming)/AMP-acid ligase II